jgi:hypothetical protein
MNKKKGKDSQKRTNRLVNYKDLERNVLEEISKEFHDNHKQSKGKQN